MGWQAGVLFAFPDAGYGGECGDSIYNFQAASGIQNGNKLNLDRAISCVLSILLLQGRICFPIPTGANAWLRGDDEKTEGIKSL